MTGSSNSHESLSADESLTLRWLKVLVNLASISKKARGDVINLLCSKLDTSCNRNHAKIVLETLQQAVVSWTDADQKTALSLLFSTRCRRNGVVNIFMFFRVECDSIGDHKLELLALVNSMQSILFSHKFSLSARVC